MSGTRQGCARTARGGFQYFGSGDPSAPMPCAANIATKRPPRGGAGRALPGFAGREACQ